MNQRVGWTSSKFPWSMLCACCVVGLSQGACGSPDGRLEIPEAGPLQGPLEPRDTSGGPGVGRAIDEDSLVADNMYFARDQMLNMIQRIGADSALIPRSIGLDGAPILVSAKDWTSGFFAGSLWYIYEYTKDADVLRHAKAFTSRLEEVQRIRNTHDVGFMAYCSFGNGLRLIQAQEYTSVLLEASKNLAGRFNSKVGCTRSWDWGQWSFPVIVDNMMNLELLYFASRTTGDPKYANIATSHARTTMKNHFRADFSSYHVVDYDRTTGAVRRRQTHQGHADSSSWARGQAWGLYGYTMSYRETKEPLFLQQAIKIADFVLAHPRLPEDRIPYWDFDAPNIPHAPRDASAGAIYASALYELSTYVEGAERVRYKSAADAMLKSLSSSSYRATNVGENHGFILQHSVGNFPQGSEVDAPLNYADYYFLEANLRKLSIEEKLSNDAP